MRCCGSASREVVDSSGAQADPVHPLDVPLALHPANDQAKVMCGVTRCCRTSS